MPAGTSAHRNHCTGGDEKSHRGFRPSHQSPSPAGRGCLVRAAEAAGAQRCRRRAWDGSLSVEKAHASSAGFTVNTAPRSFRVGAKAWRWVGTPQGHARAMHSGLLNIRRARPRTWPTRPPILRHPPGIWFRPPIQPIGFRQTQSRPGGPPPVRSSTIKS